MWLGEFLCKNNVITSEQLVSAMGGFYSSREPLGRLALKSGLLKLPEVSRILAAQADDPEPFGKVAVRLGYLVEEQVEMLIGRQSFQETIWQYMVRQDYLSQETLNFWTVEYHKSANYEEAPARANA